MKRREVAALFGVNPSTVDRWAKSGLLGAAVMRTPGGQYRYKRDQITARAKPDEPTDFSSLNDD